MSLETWLHFAHVAGAIVWVGGGVALSVIAFRARESGGAVLADLAATLSYVGLRMFTPAVVVVLITGVWLVILGAGAFTQLWVQIALGAFAIAFLIGAVYLSRSAIELERVLKGPQPDMRVARGALERWLRGYAVVLAILVFAVWDMVFKPGV